MAAKVLCVCKEDRKQEQQDAEDFCASAIASGGTVSPGSIIAADLSYIQQKSGARMSCS